MFYDMYDMCFVLLVLLSTFTSRASKM